MIVIKNNNLLLRMFRTVELKKCYLQQSTVLIGPIIIYTIKKCFALFYLLCFSLLRFLFLKQSVFCFNFKGNLAPESAVLKLSGKDIGPFRGPVSSYLGFSSGFFRD